MTEADKRAKLVEEARTYKGVRWRHQGRTRQGVDCAGLVAVAARDAIGFPHDLTTYERWPHQETVQDYASKWAIRKDKSEAKPGDVFVMVDVEQNWPCHFALVTETEPVLKIIHSMNLGRRIGRVAETVVSADMYRKIVGCWEFKEVKDG